MFGGGSVARVPVCTVGPCLTAVPSAVLKLGPRPTLLPAPRVPLWGRGLRAVELRTPASDAACTGCLRVEVARVCTM